MANIIEVKNLVKRYRKATVNAVDDVSFSVEEGSFFSLLGPNGAGKTTILTVLNTTLSKTSGEVTIAGFDLEKNPAEVRSNIGVIFQNPSLDANLTAEENVRFHTNLYGIYSYSPSYKLMDSEYKNRINELAEVLDLKSDDLFKPVKNLSGGMKRKLEIIRGLMHNPKVLFLDEPTTGLDPLSRRNLWNYLIEVRKKNKITIFLTTHYLDEAEKSDQICIINKGKIVASGTPDKIKKDLIDEYLAIDSADRESLSGELNHKGILYKESGPFKIDLKSSSEAQQLLKKIDTKLSYINIFNPTLEEAYIDIIQKENNE